MNIEVPEDLSALTREQLTALEARLDDARTAVRIELRLMASHAAPVSKYAGRPRWAQALGSLVDGPNRKKADRYVLLLAILVVLFFSLPSLLNSLIVFGEKYQASHYRGVPPSPPTAPTLTDESR